MLEYIRQNVPLLTLFLTFIFGTCTLILNIMKEQRERRKERAERLQQLEPSKNETSALPPRKVTHSKH